MTPEYFYSGGGEIIPVIDLESAHQAIELISEQGEGFGGRIYDAEHELAHYYRFEQLVLGRYYQDGDLPGQPSGPELTVDWDAAFPSKTDAAMADYPRDSELFAAAEQFNRSYADFLELLTRAYNGRPALAARCGGGHVPAARSDDPADPQPDPRSARRDDALPRSLRASEGPVAGRKTSGGLRGR